MAQLTAAELVTFDEAVCSLQRLWATHRRTYLNDDPQYGGVFVETLVRLIAHAADLPLPDGFVTDQE